MKRWSRERTLMSLRGRGAHTALVLLFLALAFQNCGRFELAPRDLETHSFASTGGSDLVPATDRVVADCLNNSSFDACLFQKNPVASRYQPYEGTPGGSESLDVVQKFGVRLTGLDSSGRLANSTFHVDTVTGQPVSTVNGSLRIRAQNDSSQQFLQLMTYYWINRAKEYLEARTGIMPAKDQALRVVIDESIAGWAPGANTIFLKNDSSGNKMGWSADLAIYFFGLANLHYASNGSISNYTAAKHRDCALVSMGCCQSAIGCGRAIASGVGDYFVAMMFPDQPIVGETWANRVGGLNVCGLNRDLQAAATVTAPVAFGMCGSSNAGEATTMGTVYASIWWEVRRAAGSAGAADIDTLFMSHLSALNGGDDFRTALAKIKAIDQMRYGGRYSSLFDTQCSARGL
jgi:hypothetical protein